MRGRGRFIWLFAVLVAAGVLIQAWLGSRGGIGGDQYVLFDLGLDYVEKKELSAVGKGMSGGGFIPGSLLQLLIGVPFSIWHDYRSPVILVGVLHVIAVIMATLTVARAAGERPALFFLAVCWLSPWRLYHSGFLWEPSYVFFPAALHLWACWRLRGEKGALASAVLAWTILISFQIHGSFIYLVILTVILLTRRLIRFQWEGGLLGAVVGGLTLLPAAAALLEGTLPSPAPSQSFLGYGLVTVVPLLKGFLYWFRLGSLDIGRRLTGVLFLRDEWVGGDPLHLIVQAGAAALVALSAASVLIALAASWWYFGRSRRVEAREEGWFWLRSYALGAFLAVLAASALSPVTIQSWHVLIALPAACLPVSLWLAEVWPRHRGWVRGALVLFLLLRFPDLAVIGFGHEMYRPDPGIAAKLQPRQQTLLPEHLRNPGAK